MKLTITKTERLSPVSIMHLEGNLDSTNYETLLTEAQNLYNAGIRDLILDMSMLTYISSAGLNAIHQIARLFREKERLLRGEGWKSHHRAVSSKNQRSRSRPYEAHVKLLSPTKEVSNVLEVVGFSSFFEIHTTLEGAINSFSMAALPTSVRAREEKPLL